MHHSYSVAETARLFGVHRNTVRGWIKAGLPVIPLGREQIILGEELRGFLQRRQSARRTKTPPGALYCFKCRAPRRPPPGLAELRPALNGTGDVIALCGDCGTVMHRRVSLVRLAEAGFGGLSGSLTRPQQRKDGIT